MEQANSLYNEGKFKEALELYKSVAITGDNPALCYFNIANAFYQIDSIPQSVAYYKACIFKAPGYYRAYLNLAITYYSLGELSSCIAILKRALPLEPNDQKGNLLLATACRKTGSVAESIITFEKLNNLYPELDEPYIQIAEMYLSLKDFKSAENWLNLYPVGGVNNSYVFTVLADICHEQSDFKRELFYLERAFSSGKQNKLIYYRIVTLTEQLGNDLVAFEKGREGITMFSGFADLALLTGNIAFKRGMYVQAEFCYNEAYKSGSASAVVGLENVRKMKSVINSTE